MKAGLTTRFSPLPPGHKHILSTIFISQCARNRNRQSTGCHKTEQIGVGVRALHPPGSRSQDTPNPPARARATSDDGVKAQQPPCLCFRLTCQKRRHMNAPRLTLLLAPEARTISIHPVSHFFIPRQKDCTPLLRKHQPSQQEAETAEKRDEGS
ncbi:hypothetical protein GJ744_008574 [Endocarpon pusillum]|uniref:Uncharacterized protein n=1 Tax=Endocarpon pusillum TaxID=364733 RepID=A0A8H7APL0_9EURO|nr:hypothetical protein GJ744_008574 [Endocarpon pusillum]